MKAGNQLVHRIKDSEKQKMKSPAPTKNYFIKNNAEKHTTQGEIRLHCSLTENPGYITFSVTDTGTGIPRNTRKPSSNVLKRPTTSGKAPAWDSISAAS